MTVVGRGTVVAGAPSWSETWRQVTIGDLGEFVNGYAFKSTDWTDGRGDPIIRIQNLTDASKPYNRYVGTLPDRYRVRRGDLLVSWSASLDAFVWDGPDAWLNQHIFKVTPHNTIVDPQFLYFLMKREIRSIALSARGSTMKHVTGKLFRQHPVMIPSLDEQRRLARIFLTIQRSKDAYDRCAVAASKLGTTLNRMLFPLSLTAAPQMVLGASASWQKTTLGDQIALQRGFDITKDDQRSGSVPVVSSSGIKSFHDTAMARAPGVVIGRKGSLGTAHYVATDYWPHDTTLWVTDFKANDPRFVYHFLRQFDVSHLDVGASNPTLNRNHLYPMVVVWPDHQTQRRIVQLLDTLQARARSDAKVSAGLTRVFDSCLAALLSGASLAP